MQPWAALNQDLHHVRQVWGSGSGRALCREKRDLQGFAGIRTHPAQLALKMP